MWRRVHKSNSQTESAFVMMPAMTPQPARRPRGDRCPSCERFIGPADHCPYCGEASAKAPALRYLRAAAFLLALAGLACLTLMVRHRELPVVRVASITPMMNFAYVRVVGRVVHAPYVVNRDGQVDYASFLLDDGSGTVRVQTHRKLARRLVETQSLPPEGALVDVAGSLNVSAEDEPRLRLQAQEQMRVLSARDGG